MCAMRLLEARRQGISENKRENLRCWVLPRTLAPDLQGFPGFFGFLES